MEYAHQHNWYIRQGDEVRGPFPAGLVSRYILLGRVKIRDQVSADGETWVPVRDVPGLIPEVLLEAARNRDDPEMQERLAAARRWADERLEPGDPNGDGERRDPDDPELAEHRRVVAQREEALEPGRSRRGQYAILAVIVAGVLALPFLLPTGEGPGQPQCGAPPSTGVNWSSCDKEQGEFANATLRGAYLRNVNLTGAVLRAADLAGADLAYADLGAANLRAARLEGARLKGADLRGADLSNADLRRADLSYADLRGARLGGAMFDGARLDHALWRDDIVCLPDSVGTCRPGKPAG